MYYVVDKRDTARRNIWHAIWQTKWRSFFKETPWCCHTHNQKLHAIFDKLYGKTKWRSFFKETPWYCHTPSQRLH